MISRERRDPFDKSNCLELPVSGDEVMEFFKLLSFDVDVRSNAEIGPKITGVDRDIDALFNRFRVNFRESDISWNFVSSCLKPFLFMRCWGYCRDFLGLDEVFVVLLDWWRNIDAQFLSEVEML